MIKFKVVTEHSKTVLRFIEEIKANSENMETAGKVFTNFSFYPIDLSQNEVASVLSFEHLFPSFIWKLGLITLAFSLLFSSWFLLIPTFLFFSFGILNTPYFFFLIFRLGLRKKGYKGKIRFMRCKLDKSGRSA